MIPCMGDVRRGKSRDRELASSGRGLGRGAGRGGGSCAWTGLLGSAQVGTRCPDSTEKLSAPELYTFEGLILLCLFNSLTPTKANYKRTAHAVPGRPCAQ